MKPPKGQMYGKPEIWIERSLEASPSASALPSLALASVLMMAGAALLALVAMSASPAPTWAQGPGLDQDDAPIYLPLSLGRSAHETAVYERNDIFGLQISELRFREAAMIEGIRDSGASLWRTFLFWDEVEPERKSPPVYDWAHYDHLFGQAQAQGLSVITEIQGNPRWAAEYPGGPPNNVDTLAAFVAAAVERYDGDGIDDAPGGIRIRYWELYNEPDNRDADLALKGRGWGFWGNQGAEYARMLKRVYPVIKLSNPQAEVILGGIAHEDVPGEDWPFNINFLDDVLKAGGGNYFDIMNFHYYPLFAPNWAEHGVGVIGKTRGIERKLANYGLKKPIMVTEAGMWSDAEPPYPPATPIDQVRYVAKLYSRALATGIRGVVWFQYDDVDGVDDPARGLVDGELADKPSRTAFRVASKELAGVTAPRPARDLMAQGEVYWFRQGEDLLGVAWTEDGSSRWLSLPTLQAERVHALGNRSILRDETDGKLDGMTEIPYGADPVFIRIPKGWVNGGMRP